MAKELITNTHEFVEENRGEFMMSLSSDLDIDAFIAAVTTALVMNKDVVEKCTAESIKKACIKAAYDGLRPDNKEGALVPYYNSATKCMEAQWMVMVYGIRKKARKHDDIIIQAEVVYKNDHFVVVKGDDDRIEHTPAPMDQDPGEIIAAYSIFRKGDQILHREVLRKSDLDAVRNAASDNSPAWKKWKGEMSRKAAVNRGSKSVPMSDATRLVIERDNELYDFGQSARDITPKPVALAGRFAGRSAGGFDPSNVRQLDAAGQVPMDQIDQTTGEIVETPRSQQSSPRSTASKAQGDDASGSRQTSRLPDSKFREYGAALVRCMNADNLKPTHDSFWNGDAPAVGPDYELARAIYGIHSDRLKNGSNLQAAIIAVTKLIEKDFPL